MKKSARKRRKRARAQRSIGAPPGTLTAVSGAVDSAARVICYDTESHEELAGLVRAVRHDGKVTWVDVVGIGSVEIVSLLGERFGLHTLALEDVLHPHQRAKVEEYPDSLFIVMRAVREVAGATDVEQISMFLGADFVVTFQEREGDAFEPVRERIRHAQGRIRSQGASYLAYALVDAVADAMFPVIETFDARLDALDEQVFRSPEPRLAEEIHSLNQDLRSTRRAVLPLREAVSRLARDAHPLVATEVRLYLRDCQDHLSQLIDLLEAHRELAKALSDAHLSALGHRSNEVMKVLTIIATIFMPLGFIAGLYGMNFDTSASPYNMPELALAWGYPGVLTLMATLAAGMLVYFGRKGWL